MAKCRRSYVHIPKRGGTRLFGSCYWPDQWSKPSVDGELSRRRSRRARTERDYVIDQISGSEPVSFPAFQGTVAPGSTTAIDIPTAEGLSSLSCKVTTTDFQGKQSVTVLGIEANVLDQRVLRVLNQVGEDRITARLEGNHFSSRRKLVVC